MTRGGAALACLAALLAIAGWARLRVDNSPSAWLDPNSPAVAAWREGQQRFGPDDFLYFVRPGVDPFDAAAWRDQRALANALRRVARVHGVSDLTQIAEKLRLGGDEPPGPDGRERLVGSPLLAGRLLGRDGRGVAVVAWSEGGDSASRAALFSDAQTLAGEHGGWTVAGPLAFNARLDELTRVDSARVVAAMALVAGLGAALALRSWIGALAALAGAGWAVGAWFAALGWIGLPVSAAVAAGLPLLAVAGVENSLHVWMGASERGSFRGAARALAKPLLAANATTALSLAALALSPLQAIRVAGLTLPVAIAASHAWAAFVLPATLDWLRVAAPPRRSTRGLRGACAAMARFGLRRRAFVATACAALIAAGAFAATRLPSETNIALQLSPDSALAADLRAVEETLGGSLPATIEIESPDDPASALRGANALAERLRADPRVASVASTSDFLTLALGDEEKSGGLARRAMEAAALAASPPADSLFHAASGVARVEVLLPQLPSEELEEFFREHGARFGEAPGGVRATGVAALMLMAQRDLLHGQFLGMAASFGLVALCLVLFFRRARPVVAALPPNLFPVAVAALSLWAMAWPLDFASAQLAAMIFGLSVNGTLYLASAAEGTEGGGERRMVARFASMGPSVVAAGAMAAAAFTCSLLSELASIRDLGAIAAVACLSATLADLAVLPALLRSSRAR